jgi:hypothetical protein
LLAAEPTVSVTLWTTPLPALDEALREPPPVDDRPFFDAVLRDLLLLLFARLLEPAVVRLARERLDVAADRLELGRFDPDVLAPPPLDVLLVFERVLDERCVESAMGSFLSRIVQALPAGQIAHARGRDGPHRGGPPSSVARPISPSSARDHRGALTAASEARRSDR